VKTSPGLARRLATSTLHAASGRLASVIVWVLLTPPVLRALGTEGFAVWSLFYALTGYFGAFDFGLAQGTLRAVAAARERGEPGSGGSFASLALAGYAALAIVWLAVTLVFRDAVITWLRVPPSARDATDFAFAAGAGVFFCAGAANTIMAVLQGHGRFDLGNRVLITSALTQGIGIPLALRMGWGLPGLVVTVGAGWILGGVVGLWLVRRSAPEFRWQSVQASLPVLRETVRFGAPLQLATMLTVMHAHLDKFLIPRFVSLAAVTPYELGFRVLGSAVAIPLLMQVTILPAAAALHAGANRARLLELYLRVNRYMLAVAAVTVAVLFAAADRVYAAWLGPGHGDAAFVLRWLSLASAVSFTITVATTIARGVGRTDLELWLGITALALHLGASLVLIPRYGLAGALISIQVGQLVGCTLFLFLLARTLAWPMWRTMFEPLARPLVALVAGIAAGMAIDRVLPHGGGMLPWATLLVVAGVSGGVAALVAFLTRLVDFREARDLVMAARGGTSE
jgi:O-antigen/teichoic acid export membrane protein